MARKASPKSGKAAPKAAKPAAQRKKPKASEARSRTAGKARTTGKKANAADALVGLLESPLVADLLAAAISAAAATVIAHKMKGGRAEGSLVRAVGTATAAAVGRHLAAEFQDMQKAAKEPRAAK
jgi:hypothetical protein